MPKKFQSLGFTLLFLITFSCQGVAMPPSAPKNMSLSINDAEPEGTIEQASSDTNKDEKKAPTKEYDELQKELDALIKEMKRLEKVFRKKFEKDVLPHLKKEIERLREWLKEFQPKDEPPEPKPAEKRHI